VPVPVDRLWIVLVEQRIGAEEPAQGGVVLPGAEVGGTGVVDRAADEAARVRPRHGGTARHAERGLPAYRGGLAVGGDRHVGGALVIGRQPGQACGCAAADGGVVEGVVPGWPSSPRCRWCTGSPASAGTGSCPSGRYEAAGCRRRRRCSSCCRWRRCWWR